MPVIEFVITCPKGNVSLSRSGDDNTLVLVTSENGIRLDKEQAVQLLHSLNAMVDML